MTVQMKVKVFKIKSAKDRFNMMSKERMKFDKETHIKSVTPIQRATIIGTQNVKKMRGRKQVLR